MSDETKQPETTGNAPEPLPHNPERPIPGHLQEIAQKTQDEALAASDQATSADEKKPEADGKPEAKDEDKGEAEKRGPMPEHKTAAQAEAGAKNDGNPADAAVLAEAHRHTRRSFLVGGVAAAAIGGFYAYLNLSPEDETQPNLLRDAFLFNAKGSKEVFREHALAPTYPLSRAETLRVNGMYGLGKALVPATYRLQMVGVRNDKASPLYVKDVTAWNYEYSDKKDNEDPGHNTKLDPSKEAHPDGAAPGGAPPAGGSPAPGAAPAPPPAKGQAPPNAGHASKGATPGKAPATAPGKAAPPAPGRNPAQGQGDNNDKSDASDTSQKMAPAKMQDQAKNDQSKQGDDSRKHGDDEDDDHLGRKPRGMEEAGESDSTLRAGTPGLLLEMPDITKFPRHELVTQFKCIEGWSQIVHWAGIRMSDFLDAYPPELIDGKEPKYVYMETPDGDYYVGYDLHVLRHPQTLLVTEMMGQPLTQFHGAPLRLHTPLKYGYKQIKRIGLIAYTNDKPDDYWTKLGYDWYAGL